MSTTVVKSDNATRALMNAFSRRGVRSSVGTLRAEALLGNSSQYQFTFNSTQTLVSPTEVRLPQADAFIPTKIGVFIRKAGTSTSPTAAEQMVSVLHTFPNSLTFTGSGEAANLEALYFSSTLAINFNSVQLASLIDLADFRRVGQAQAGVQVSQQSAGIGSNGAYLKNQWEEDYGYVDFNLRMALNGNTTNQMSISMNTPINCAGTNSANYLVIKLKGVHLINGGNFIKDGSLDVFNQMK